MLLAFDYISFTLGLPAFNFKALEWCKWHFERIGANRKQLGFLLQTNFVGDFETIQNKSLFSILFTRVLNSPLHEYAIGPLNKAVYFSTIYINICAKLNQNHAMFCTA
jgi:hypothetical protein